jgi:hypothetical protein
VLGFAAMVLLAVELGGGFGSASANVVSTTDDSLRVELRVEVKTSVSSVVAHLALPGEPTLTLPMLERGGGEFGITTELRRADYTVVFEALGNPSLQSQPVSLTGLGADLGDAGIESTPGTDEEEAGEDRRLLWLALALGAASLSALAFWVLGDRDEPDEDESQIPSEPDISVS